MKKRLHVCLMLLLVILSGCVHLSRLEVRSSDTGAFVANTKAVEKEVGDILATLNFIPARDTRIKQSNRADTDVVDEWYRVENRGFWHGEEFMSVMMHAEGDLILLVVSSGEGDRRSVVEGIGATLEKRLHDKFPELKIHVTSYSDVHFGAP